MGMQDQSSGEAAGASSLEDLISSASKQADEVAARAQTLTPDPTLPKPVQAAKEEPADTKITKKEKDGKDKAAKPSRLVYSDNEISPEEKMAALDRYKFTPTQGAITA